MGRKKTVTKKPRYFEAIAWIADNDSAGNDDNADAVKEYVTVCLIADLFGADVARVATDVVRHRAGVGRGHVARAQS